MSADQTIDSNCHFTPKDLNSTMNDSIISTIGAIHSKSQTSFLSLKTKSPPSKPPFGTTANRQIDQLKGHKQSDIVAYSRINYQLNQKYHDRYQQIQAKLTPFMSTSQRFDKNKFKHPGPGQYALPDIFKAKREIKTQQGPMFCPFKRWEAKQNCSPQSKYQKEKSAAYCYKRQTFHTTNSFEIQQKIKEKREKMKEKMLILRQNMKKPQITCQFMFKRMGYSECEQNIKPQPFQPTNKISQHQKKIPKVKNLKQLTKKYLPKINYDFQRQQYRTSPQIKSLKEKYNNQAIFKANHNDLFSSYIPKRDGLDPGHYQKYEKKQKKTFKPKEKTESYSIENF